jgi:hypothetical protein
MATSERLQEIKLKQLNDDVFALRFVVVRLAREIALANPAPLQCVATIKAETEAFALQLSQVDNLNAAEAAISIMGTLELWDEVEGQLKEMLGK